MKVIFTAPAREDLREIRTFMKAQYSGSMRGFEGRLRAVLVRLATWPRSAPEVSERGGVRLVLVRRYPYKLYYTITQHGVEVLHVHHDKRQPWEAE